MPQSVCGRAVRVLAPAILLVAATTAAHGFGSYSVSVVWEEINSPLDGNPMTKHQTLDSQGLRIFPGKPTASGGDPMQIVWAVATVNPPDENVQVYFKLLDVDDPSTHLAPVVADVPGAEGGDNRRTYDDTDIDPDNPPDPILKPHGIFWEQRKKATLAEKLVYDAETGSDGKARVRVRVSCSPGDNYVVAASLSAAQRDGFGEDNDEVVLIPEAQRTDMLTVWRKLHVEVDSMGEAVVSTPDDAYFADVPSPDLSMYNDAFFWAYTETAQDTGHDDSQTAFTQSFATDAAEKSHVLGPIQGSRNDDHLKWWVVYILGAYEPVDSAPDPWPDWDDDNDDDDEEGLVGGTWPTDSTGLPGPDGSLVYQEVARDVAAQHAMGVAAIPPRVALHEIGHHFFAQHMDDLPWIMWVPEDDDDEANIPIMTDAFDADNIHIIRSQGITTPKYP